MLFKIPRLYDSHTHFQATGEWALGLNLAKLQSPSELQSLPIKPSYFRGKWMVGFGWSGINWSESGEMSLSLLDRIFPDYPVLLTRIDGHSSWVNSLGLKELELSSATGYLAETDHLKAYFGIPEYSKEQRKQQLLAACGIFNSAGFTHVRDMTGSESQWNLLSELESESLLTVAIEENFAAYDMNEVDKALALSLYSRQNETPLLRSKGIKIFYDGTLGAQTAYLSKPYVGGELENRGCKLWPLADVEEILRRAWEKQLEVSVHTIGDEAAHEIISCARSLSAKGHVGRLNMEHVQMLRPETIQMMKPLHVRCYMQPCHWLSDKVWLKERLGDLYTYVFPWEPLRAAKIPLFFGCDSPIEPPNFFRNLQALEESPKAGIKKFKDDIAVYHSHPDKNYAPDSWTLIEDGQIKEVHFGGRSLALNNESFVP